jgi:hypothetical protein
VKPEEFFTSPEFNVDLCLEFSMLFATLLEGHEQTIGTKLSLLEPKVRHDIGRKLEMMCPKAHDKHNPFKLIATAMTPKEEEKQIQEIPVQKAKTIEVIPDVSNPNGMFNSQLRTRKVTIENPGPGYESSSDEEQEDRHSSCCGLFQ